MKIVFFINLDKTDKNKGIYKLFSTIQDNAFVMRYFYSTTIDRVTTNHFTEKFLGITKNEVKLSNIAKDIKNSGIILIDDNTSLDECKDLFNPDTLVLYHSKPEWADNYFKENKNNIKKAKKDIHERSAKCYMILKDLAEAFEFESNSFKNSEYENIIKQIVKFFEVDEELENRLEFLHKCLNPKTVLSLNIGDKGLNASDKTINKFTEFFKYMSANINKDFLMVEKDYIDKLSDFRDSLLSDYD